MFGLTDEDVADQAAVEMWPDTEQSIRLFASFRSQWRMGFAGPVSLDYAALPAVMRLSGVKRSAWPEVFQDIQVMEAETLRLIHKER